MKKFLLLFGILFFSASIFADPIKDLVIFGDSLTDDGNLYNVIKILPKSPPYYRGRFTNGLTWAEYLGMESYRKHSTSYSNYAYGGATAILHRLRTDSFIAPVILQEEVEGYLLRSKRKNKKEALYGIWIGANDYLYERTLDVEGLTKAVVDKTIDAMQKLIDVGGEHFFVLNLPDLAMIPFARNHNVAERLGKITEMHNYKLKRGLAILQQKYPHINFAYVDINAIFVDLLQNLGKYNEKYHKNVTDITNSCWTGTVLGLAKHDIEMLLTENTLPGQTLLDKPLDISRMRDSVYFSPVLQSALKEKGTLCSNPDNYLFWDDMHPTAVIHEVLGKILVDQLLG